MENNIQNKQKKVSKFRKFISKFAKNESGVTAIEYALIAVAISSVLFLVLGTGGQDGLTSKIKEAFTTIQDGLSVSKEAGGQGGGGSK